MPKTQHCNNATSFEQRQHHSSRTCDFEWSGGLQKPDYFISFLLEKSFMIKRLVWFLMCVTKTSASLYAPFCNRTIMEAPFHVTNAFKIIKPRSRDQEEKFNYRPLACVRQFAVVRLLKCRETCTKTMCNLLFCMDMLSFTCERVSHA